MTVESPDGEWVPWMETETIPNEGDPWLPWFAAILLVGLLVGLAAVVIAVVIG